MYTRDDISRQAPGKRDTVVVTENSERKTFQKRHLSMTIMEAYQIFKNEYLHNSIGKSKFAQLRPKCVVYSSDLTQYVYTCIYHENFMLIIQALHRIDSIYPLYSHDLPNKFVCFQPNDDCWFSKCNQCKYALMFCKNYLLQKNSTLQQIRWYQWENAVNSAGKKTIGEYWRRL